MIGEFGGEVIGVCVLVKSYSGRQQGLIHRRRSWRLPDNRSQPPSISQEDVHMLLLAEIWDQTL
jgi:hypothetical protein